MKLGSDRPFYFVTSFCVPRLPSRKPVTGPTLLCLTTNCKINTWERQLIIRALLVSIPSTDGKNRSQQSDREAPEFHGPDSARCRLSATLNAPPGSRKMPATAGTSHQHESSINKTVRFQKEFFSASWRQQRLPRMPARYFTIDQQ